MAIRLNRLHSENVIARIKTSALVTRLQKNALGTLTQTQNLPDGTTREVPHEMSRSQVAAAQFLIERTLAKAEAIRELRHSGTISLETLILGAADFAEDTDDRRDSPSQPAH
jgi:hypothetical protein